MSKRLGVTTKSLYDWVQRSSKPDKNQAEDAKLEVENRRLKAELARVTEERDIFNLEGSENSLGNCFPQTRPQRTSRIGQSEVRVHRRASPELCDPRHVQLFACSSKWYLCLAQKSIERTWC